jgi:hypothetical protein
MDSVMGLLVTLSLMPAHLPIPSGPFSVGRIAYHWIDQTRLELLSLIEMRTASSWFTSGIRLRHRCARLRLRRLMCGKPAAFRQAAQPKCCSVRPEVRKGRAFPHIGRQSRYFFTPCCTLGYDLPQGVTST